MSLDCKGRCCSVSNLSNLICFFFFCGLCCLLSKRSPWCWLRWSKLALSMVVSSLVLFQLVLAEPQLTVFAFVCSSLCATSSVSSRAHVIRSANAAGLGRDAVWATQAESVPATDYKLLTATLDPFFERPSHILPFKWASGGRFVIAFAKGLHLCADAGVFSWGAVRIVSVQYFDSLSAAAGWMSLGV